MKSPLDIAAYARLPSPLGPLLLACTEHGLCGLWFDDQKHLPAWLPTTWDDAPPQHPVLQRAASLLQAYFSGASTSFDLPLDLHHGTPFQRAVWEALREIPPGVTLTYSLIAQRIGRPQAVRAVGAAIGRNPVGIIVPCHRVLGANGQLTGYAGGLWRKTALLQLEQPMRRVPSVGSQHLFS